MHTHTHTHSNKRLELMWLTLHGWRCGQESAASNRDSPLRILPKTCTKNDSNHKHQRSFTEGFLRGWAKETAFNRALSTANLTGKKVTSVNTEIKILLVFVSENYISKSVLCFRHLHIHNSKVLFELSDYWLVALWYRVSSLHWECWIMDLVVI